MRVSVILFLTCFIPFVGQGQEGMWIPSLLSQLNEEEMIDMGMKMSAEDVYRINDGSLKDAVVHFGGFCTGEIISSQGLVLTNHHCGYRAIQSHSTVENNLLESGFWAMSKQEELPNPGLFVTFIEEIRPVSDIILRGVTDQMTEEKRKQIITENINSYKDQFETSDFQDVVVKSFYKGNEYYAFVTLTYTDVRLVGAPPSSIGKFGADTDNWVWPRHTGDFALFRVYAGPDNKPADYSEENIPFQPKHHLPISLDGVEEGDFTLVFGFPGRTNEYLPAIAIEQMVQQVNPARIEVRDRALEVIDKEMKADPTIKIQYAAKFASIANYWKKWQGENLGLTSSKAVQHIRNMEEKFTQVVSTDDAYKEYSDILPTLERIYTSSVAYRTKDAVYQEIVGRNIEALRIASYVDRLIQYYNDGGESQYESLKSRLSPFVSSLLEDYDQEVDYKVATAILPLYEKQFSGNKEFTFFQGDDDMRQSKLAEIFSESAISTKQFDQWMDLAPAEAVPLMKNDPMVNLYQALRSHYEDHILDGLLETQEPLDSVERLYMKAQMDVLGEATRMYPDANSSMRVTYGQVKGYSPKDAVWYEHQTYLEGVMEKYKPGDYEFDVPAKLIDLYQAKDYGQYGEDGKMPVCFIGSNHTTGGNSGSPAIDANGNLIGLNFDRVWEGTMSDYYYDFRLCRNIMVDARYILFIVDKFANASHLVEEMDLVHPKDK